MGELKYLSTYRVRETCTKNRSNHSLRDRFRLQRAQSFLHAKQRQRCAYYRGDPLNGLNGSDLTSFTGHSIPGAAAP